LCCSSLGLVDGALVVRACGDGLCLEDLHNKASFCCLLLGLAVVVLFPSLTGRGGEGGGSSCCRLELRLGGTRRSSHSLVIGCSGSWSSPWFLVRFQWWKPTGFLAADLLNKHPRLCCVSINTQSVVLAGRGGGGDVGMDGGVAAQHRLLPLRAHRRVAVSATGILGRMSGEIARRRGVPATSRREAPLKPCVGALHRVLTKWCVPGESSMAGGEVSVRWFGQRTRLLSPYVSQGLWCKCSGLLLFYLSSKVLYVFVTDRQ